MIEPMSKISAQASPPEFKRKTKFKSKKKPSKVKKSKSKREKDISFSDGDSADILELLVANERISYGTLPYSSIQSQKPRLIPCHEASKENNDVTMTELSISERSSTLDKSCQSANIPYHSKQRKI